MFSECMSGVKSYLLDVGNSVFSCWTCLDIMYAHAPQSVSFIYTQCVALTLHSIQFYMTTWKVLKVKNKIANWKWSPVVCKDFISIRIYTVKHTAHSVGTTSHLHILTNCMEQSPCKLVVAQLVKRFPFIDLECLLPRWQETASGPCPGSGGSSPHSHTLIL